MSRVSPIFTVHAERGAASASALCEILEHNRPEVIFVEVPSVAFVDYFIRCSKANLESTAVREYQHRNSVKIIPVDAATPDEGFFRDNQELFRAVEKRSYNYCQLVDSHSDNVAAIGFSYLNSDACSGLWSAINEEVRHTIQRLNNKNFSGHYELWKKTNDLRDRAMLDNIQEYREVNPFKDAVFLVGAAHRQSIINKTKELARVAPQIEWRFDSVPQSESTVLRNSTSI